MVCMRSARMSTGGKVLHHQLAPQGAHSSTPPFTLTLRVPCTFAAPDGDPSSASDGDSNNSGHGSNRDNGGSGRPTPQPGPGIEQMTVAATEAFVLSLAMNRTKDALLDLSLNHDRLLEENQSVRNLLSKSECLIRAYQRRDAAGTSKLSTSSAHTWSTTSSHRQGSVNQQLNGGDDADSWA
jgi:hypothetical protein